jgi:hypothetical protein
VTFPRLFEVPEVLEVQVVPSDEVRIVPEYPATTKVLLPYATALSFSVVPEVLLSHEIPSDEVRIVPALPTATYNGLEVVVVVLLSSLLFLAQEMTVRLKRNTEKNMSRCFTLFPIVWFRRTQYIPELGLFYKNLGFYLEVNWV